MNKESFTLSSDSVLNLFSSNITEIARTFLNGKLSTNVKASTFENIRETSIQELDLNKDLVPLDEMEFYQYICREVLSLTKAPQEELLKKLKEAIDDLNFIHQTRVKYENILKEIDKSKDIDGKQYKLNLNRHYLKKIKKDEDDLIEFLRKDLFASALYNSVPSQWPLFFRYPFRTAKFFYQHENISEIFHKITFAPVPEVSYYSILYKENKDEFFRIIRQKYQAENLISDIKNRIQTNHILNERKSILDKLLNFYSKREWEVFANICPAQIEGLLYKLAIEIGIDPKSLKTSSITDKATFIFEKSNLFNEYDYEYFAFVFPIIRNRISHGLDLGDNLSDSAYSLLFDLHTISNFFISFKFKYNEAVYEMNKIAENEEDIFHLIQYVDLLGTKIPPFYETKYSDKEIKSLLRKEFIFDKIKSRVTKGTVFGVTLPSSAKKIEKLSINLDECKKVIEYYKNDYS